MRQPIWGAETTVDRRSALFPLLLKVHVLEVISASVPVVGVAGARQLREAGARVVLPLARVGHLGAEGEGESYSDALKPSAGRQVEFRLLDGSDERR